MSSKLAEMQARFQQKQIQEREEKLLQLYKNNQQRTFEKMSRSSSGTTAILESSTGGGKVRQMFDERRQKAGIDRSYPLEPLKSVKINNQAGNGYKDRQTNLTKKPLTKSFQQKTTLQSKNNKSVVKTETTYSAYTDNNKDDIFDEMNQNNNMLFNRSSDNSIEIHELSLTDNENKKNNIRSQIEKPTAIRQGGDGESLKENVKSGNNRHQETLIKHGKTTSIKGTVNPKKGVVQSSQSSRTPNNTRPSAKQTAKSPVARDDLNECRYCSRRFASDRLETHELICAKTTKKKRKVYDATKHRVEGTELEQYARKGTKTTSTKTNKPASKKDWRRTHEEFINAIRAAKMAQAHVAKGGKLSDLPPPPPSTNPDYIQCPHCGRKFNEAAAERHIPKCATFLHNKPKPGPMSKGKVSGKTAK